MENYTVGVKAVESFSKVMDLYPEIAMAAKHGLAVLPRVEVPSLVNLQKLSADRVQSMPAIKLPTKKM